MTQGSKNAYAHAVSIVQVEVELGPPQPQRQSLCLEATSRGIGRGLIDIQSLGSNGAYTCTSFDEIIEAVHAHVVELVLSANRAYRNWQRYLHSFSESCTETDQSLLRLLRQICIDAHSLSIRCLELGEEVECFVSTSNPPSPYEPQRLRACIQTLSQIQTIPLPETAAQVARVSSPQIIDAIYTELLGHGVWIAAATHSKSLQDIMKFVCTDIINRSTSIAHDISHRDFGVPIRISPDQNKHEVLHHFRSAVQEDLLRRAIELSMTITNATPLESSSVKRWMSTPGSFLRVVGSSVMELTIQAAITIRHLIQHTTMTSATCYFFCDQSRAPDETALDFLRTVMGQLAQQDIRAYTILVKNEHKPLRRSVEGLCSLLNGMLHCFERVNIVLQGINFVGALPQAFNIMFSAIFNSTMKQPKSSRFAVASLITFSNESQDIRESDQHLRAAAEVHIGETAFPPLHATGEAYSTRCARIIGLEKLTEMGELRWAPVTPANLTPTTALDSIVVISHALADDIGSRNLNRFAPASRVIEYLLLQFTAKRRDVPGPPLTWVQSYDKHSQVDLLHLSLVEFLAIVTRDPMLRLDTHMTSISSPSMAVFCLRYLCHSRFSVETKKGFREEKTRINHRDQVHPFYRYAATTWPRLSKDHWGDPELQCIARQFFDSTSSWNFQQWVLECARVWFPYDIGFQALSHKPLAELVSILRGAEDIRLQIAASMGLVDLCAHLLDEGANVNGASVLGTPLHAALAGLPALVGPWAHIVNEHSRLNANEDNEVQRCATIRLLLERGAECHAVSSTKNQAISTCTVALMTCSRLRNTSLFVEIFRAQPISDEFAVYFKSGFFLDVMNPMHLMDLDTQNYLNDLCKFLACNTIGSYGKAAPSKIIYESLWDFTTANNLDWFDKIDQQCVVDAIDRDDEEYQKLVVIEGTVSRNVMRLISKDPRFNPNSVCQDRTPLLLKAIDLGLDMIRILVEKGADLSARNASGLTIAHLSAQKRNHEILRYVVEQGADTGLVLIRDNTAAEDDLAGYNVWHLAASSGFETLEILIDVGIKNEEELFAICGSGNTPLANLLLALPNSSRSPETIDATIRVLRKIHICSPRLFVSTQPVMHEVVRIGSKQLIETLLGMGAQVAPIEDGSSLFHFCRIQDGIPYLRYVRKLCREMPLQNKSGQTPIETMILSSLRALTIISPSASNLLLCQATKQSKDAEGRGLWERVCINLVPRFILTKDSRPVTITSFITTLIQQNIMHDFETISKVSGVKALLDGFAKADIMPAWLATVMCIVIEATKVERPLAGCNNVAACLKWAVRLNNIQLVKLLLEHGASVHDEASGISAIQAACLSSVCDWPLFNLILEHVDVTRIDDMGKPGMRLIHMLIQKQVKQREIKLKALLGKGADPNACTEWGLSALVLSVIEDYNRCTDILLEFGADINAKNRDGKDAALAAASRGNASLLWKLFYDKRFKVDWTATCFTTYTVRRPGGTISLEFSNTNALHLAALNCSVEVLGFYLNNRLFDDVEATAFPDQYRPLHMAALAGSSVIIRYIVQRGADISARTRYGSTALHIAVETNHAGAVKTLVDLGLPIDTLDRSNHTPLICALRIGAKEVINTLLGSNPPDEKMVASKEIKGSVDRTKYLLATLDTAIRRSDLRLCRLLWSAGCSLGSALPSCHGCTPIMAALGQGRTNIVLWMLEVMDIETKRSTLNGHCHRHFENGVTSLDLACGMKNGESVLTGLLEAYLEAKINWVHWPLSPLHVCAAKDKPMAARLILDHVKKNESHLRSQFRGLPKPLDKWLLNQTISTSHLDDPYFFGLTPLNVAINEESIGTAKLLLEAGADPDLPDTDGNAPLHLAIEENCLELVKELVKHGSEIERQNSQGYTPLMLAVEEGNIDIVKTLVEAGADISTCSSERMSLLNIAGNWSSNPAIFVYLIGRGLDIYKPDIFGYYPLHDIIFDSDFTTYVVNSSFDFHRICEHEVPRGLLTVALENEGVLPRLIRRIPSRFLPDPLINVWPSRYVSPLCNAARRGDIDNLKILVEYGADLEFEGCDEGTALMVAARAGHMQVIAYLVRAGANIRYSKDGLVRSALVAGRRIRAVVQWLLVRRWTDQQQISQHGNVDTNDSVIRPWTGSIVAEMELIGVGNQHSHAWDETMLEYLQRLHKVRLGLRGQVVHSVRWH